VAAAPGRSDPRAKTNFPIFTGEFLACNRIYGTWPDPQARTIEVNGKQKPYFDTIKRNLLCRFRRSAGHRRCGSLTAAAKVTVKQVTAKQIAIAHMPDAS
jgi:hypothetical protein